MSELLVKLEDLRAAHYCGSGIRTWLAHHGFEMRVLLREGLPAAMLEATGDHFALKAVAIARSRSSCDGR